MMADGINDPIGQGVFLLEKDAKENRIGSAVGHFGQLEDRCCRVQHRNGAASDHGTDDDCLSQGARATLQQYKSLNAFEIFNK